jgi:polyhydroxyalkanoate synthesis regulator phasin
MSATIDGRRQVLSQDIGRILDEYLEGRIDHDTARQAVSDVFRAPSCRIAVNDIARYLNRVLEMVRSGDMSTTEARDNLVNMEMSFDMEVYA